MIAVHKFIVAVDEQGERLDRYVTERSSYSRSSVQKHIKSGAILVNDKRSYPHYAVQDQDVITLNEPEKVVRHVALPPSIIEETTHFVVVDKPSGLLTHQAQGLQTETTLVDWLCERYPSMTRVADPLRPGIVHRLDRDVSGLLVVALTQTMYDHLQVQFRERRVEKRYTALVYGRVDEDEGTITFRIGRSRQRHGRMAAKPETSTEGKVAETRFSVVQRFRTTTLLSLTLITGRTHQIRTHLFAKGWPIVGDRLYPTKKRYRLPALHRPFLHSSFLAFTDSAGQQHEYSSSLPDILQQYLDTLEK